MYIVIDIQTDGHTLIFENVALKTSHRILHYLTISNVMGAWTDEHALIIE